MCTRRVFGLIFGAIVAMASGAGCGSTYVSLRTTEHKLIATPVDPSEMRAAIVRALAARRYTPEQDEPGRIVARLDRGDTRVRFQIQYSPTEYTISMLEADGFEMVQGPNGRCQ